MSRFDPLRAWHPLEHIAEGVQQVVRYPAAAKGNWWRFVLSLIFLTAAHTAAAETVTIGFGGNKPPYVFENEDKGLEIEVVKAAFKAMGISMKPFYAPSKRLAVRLKEKKIDGLANVREQTMPGVFHSDVYIVYHNYAISLKHRSLSINTIEDLSNYSVVSFQRGSETLGERFRQAVELNPRYSETPQHHNRGAMLFAGRTDVVIGDKRVFEYFMRDIRHMVDVTQPLAYHDIFPPTPFQLAFHSASTRDRFNEGLAMIRKDGVYAAIELKYSGY